MPIRARRLQRNKKKCLICCVAMLLSIIYILVQNNLILKYQSSKIESTEKFRELAFQYHESESQFGIENENDTVIAEKPLIYMYTTRLHTPLIYDESCEITRDPLKFEESHAVVFHAKDLPVKDDLAQLRSKSPFVNQIWVYFNLESPINTRKVRENEMLFNFTITPMRNSDLYHPYGYHLKRAERGTESIEVKTKTRFIAWCVSNCGVEFRNQYVRLMQRYASVDVYGGCNALFGTKSVCRRGSIDCNELLATYKFYLAFENSLCRDYNTEKYWGALHRGNVPIIMAGGYDTLIPNSYINVMDFETVKDLVKYLKFLDKNNDAYMKYFTWRKEYELDFSPRSSLRNDIWLPQFCDILKNRAWSHRKVINISDFYSVEDNCPKDNVNKIVELVHRGI